MPDREPPPSIPPGAVKICGLREPEHAVAAALAGADLLGFIFAPARRQVTPETARAAIDAARRSAERRFLAVGVFVDATAEDINAVTAAAGLDLVQLHGDETPATNARLPVPAIQAIRVRPDQSHDEIESNLASFAAADLPPLAFLIDGYHPHHHGGQGVRADWRLAAVLAHRWPVLLAGGLDAAVAGDAIAAVRPLGVDVSSGVETGGVKDPEKIRAFVLAAKSAFARSR